MKNYNLALKSLFLVKQTEGKKLLTTPYPLLNKEGEAGEGFTQHFELLITHY